MTVLHSGEGFRKPLLRGSSFLARNQRSSSSLPGTPGRSCVYLAGLCSADSSIGVPWSRQELLSLPVEKREPADAPRMLLVLPPYRSRRGKGAFAGAAPGLLSPQAGERCSSKEASPALALGYS